MTTIAEQQNRIKEIQNSDKKVADKYLKVTSKGYLSLKSAINQFFIKYSDTDEILSVQKPKKSEIKQLNSLASNLDVKLSNNAKKRLKMYLMVSTINLRLYLQSLVGIQMLVVHQQYENITKKQLVEDRKNELDFQKKQLDLRNYQIDNPGDDETSSYIWDNHDIAVASIAVSLIKLLRSDSRNELLEKYLPNFDFRSSTSNSEYRPIKKVNGDNPINSVLQSEQYKQETLYRDESAKQDAEIQSEAFRHKNIKRIAIINEFNPCDLCIGYVGQIYNIDEVPELPFHHNCRCRYMPVTDEDNEE